jgi:hypothetical protein
MPPQLIGLAALDQTTGLTQWSFTCPGNVPTGPLFAFQSVVLDSTGTMSLTIPSPFTVGWRNGRIP